MSVEFAPIAVLRSAGLPADLLDVMVEPSLVAALDTADDVAAQRYAEAAVRYADAGITALCGDPRVRDAAAVANPDIHDNAVLPVADGVPRRRRKRSRSAVALLQRLATKNDTANGYGPMDLVRLSGSADLVQPGGPGVRAGLVSWWVADLIAAAVERDPRMSPHLPVRLADPVRQADGALVVGDRRVRLSADERTALAALPGVPVGDALGRLRRAGLVRGALLAPAACTDPLAELAAALPDSGPGRDWRDRLVELGQVAQQVADAPIAARGPLLARLTGKVEDLVGELPDRPSGEFYSDRGVMYEEGRARTAPYTVGGRLLRRITEALDPLCRLAAAYGHARFADASGALRDRVGDRCTLADAMRHAAAAMTFPGADRLRDAVGDAWLASGGHLGPDRLADLLDRWPGGDPSLLSPDLMLAAGPGGVGDARLVLGELHSNLQVFGLFEHFWPDSGLDEWFASLPAAERLAQLVAPRSQGKAFLCELPTRSIRVGAESRRRDSVGYGGVDVVWADGVPWLVLPDGDRRSLTPADPANPVYLALSPHTGLLPVFDGAAGHTPELTLGDLVVQRECWRVPRPHGTARTTAGQLVELRRWRSALGLPERVFVRSPGQPKPFYVDLRNPLLVDLLLHWTEPGEPLAITPMDPGPDELWLDHGSRRHCAELRMSAVVSPGRPA
ncbi:hypothetical protein ACFV4N_38950 [Actinosynnema sp. NPDC059797]